MGECEKCKRENNIDIIEKGSKCNNNNPGIVGREREQCSSTVHITA